MEKFNRNFIGFIEREQYLNDTMREFKVHQFITVVGLISWVIMFFAIGVNDLGLFFLVFNSITFSLLYLYDGLFNSSRIKSLVGPYFESWEMLVVIAIAPLSLILSLFVVHVLHLVIPGWEARSQELTEYYKTNAPPKAQDTETTLKNKITNEFLSDIDLFMKTHLQFTTHYKRFLLERISKNGEIDSSRLFLLMLIPNVKTMPLDVLREITLSLNNLEVTLSSSEISRLMYAKVLVDTYFKKLSPTEIKSIFTRPYSARDYLNLLLDTYDFELLTKQDPTFEPAITMQELVLNAPSTKENQRKRLKHPYLLNLYELNSRYEVKVLLSHSEFQNAGNTFSNCVASYYNTERSVFTLMQGSNPIACVEVMGDKIVQCSGYKNNETTPEVTAYVKDLFKRAKDIPVRKLSA